MSGISSRLDPMRLRRTLGAASCVRERGRFVLNELRDAPRVARYRLRGSDLVAQVRHPLLDMWVLEEVFRFRPYQPPAAVLGLLAGGERPMRIVDLGGHVGYFGLFARGLFPDASVVSFEPDPDSARLLRECIRMNGLDRSWSVIEACATTADGEVDFTSSHQLSRMGPEADRPVAEMHRRVGRAFEFMSGSTLLTSVRRRVAGRDAFPFLVEADLVKIDIEGAEWDLLDDPRLSELKAPALVLEYHPVDRPGRDAAADVRERLTAAGYDGFADVGATDTGMLWAWRA